MTAKKRTVRNESAPEYNPPPTFTLDTTSTDDERRMEDVVLAHAAEIAKARLVRLATAANPATTRTYIASLLQARENEVFGVLLLDAQHRVIEVTELFQGTIDGASVYPREVVKLVLKHNAAAVIFYHNHPSGEPEPSLADRQITRRLTEALALIDVRVLDHLVVGGTETVSFAERGLL